MKASIIILILCLICIFVAVVCVLTAITEENGGFIFGAFLFLLFSVTVFLTGSNMQYLSYHDLPAKEVFSSEEFDLDKMSKDYPVELVNYKTNKPFIQHEYRGFRFFSLEWNVFETWTYYVPEAKPVDALKDKYFQYVLETESENSK